jgi:hypothetical protein
VSVAESTLNSGRVFAPGGSIEVFAVLLQRLGTVRHDDNDDIERRTPRATGRSEGDPKKPFDTVAANRVSDAATDRESKP